jgi:hypothetical protein
MGIGVETSWLGRRVAELATGAVDDYARQDENHADDAEEVGGVLQAEAVVAGVVARRRVDDDVERAGRHHQQQAGAAHEREGTDLPEPLRHSLYRQHALLIHRIGWAVNSIGSCGL